jgi:hypothetical protein
MTVGYVRKLLAELAEYGYLVAPQKYKAAKGRFAYTPYTLPPQALTTVTVEEPARSDNQHGQTTSTVESIAAVQHDQPEISTDEYVHARGDAATRVNNLSLEQKQKDRQTDSVKPVDTRSDDDGLTAEERQVKSGFEGVFGPMNDDWLTELQGLIKYYSNVFVSVAIGNARTTIQGGGRIEKPMNYIRGALVNMASEGKIPHLLPLNPVASKFSPAAPMPYSPTTTVPNVAPAPVNIHPKQRIAPSTEPHVQGSLSNFKRQIAERRERERVKDYVPGSTV